MNKIVNWYSNINIDALFEIYGNPVQYIIKTGLKELQQYLKNEDIIPKQDIKTLRYVYNICDHVLYEDDEVIKELWAKLLLNAIDKKSNTPVKNIFISILADMDSKSAKFFENLMIYYSDHWSEFQDGIVYFHMEDYEDNGVSVSILVNLGLIKEIDTSYKITPLGEIFFSAISRN